MKYKNLPKYNEGMHFVTTKTYQNNTYFLDKTCCDILIEELDFYRKKYDFKIPGYGIMPDHLHLLIWWNIEKDKELTISKIIQGIKGYSAIKIINYIKTTGRLEHLLQSDESGCSHLPYKHSQSTLHLPHKRELKYKIWQPGFYDYNILYEEKFVEKLEYIHNNSFCLIRQCRQCQKN